MKSFRDYQAAQIGMSPIAALPSEDTAYAPDITSLDVGLRSESHPSPIEEESYHAIAIRESPKKLYKSYSTELIKNKHHSPQI